MDQMQKIVLDYFEEIDEFKSKSIIARDHSFERYKLEESKIENLTDIRTLTDGLILKISKRFYSVPPILNDNISYQIGLCASFLRTHFLINDLIMSGDIIEATILIRKQLESSIRFSELEKKAMAQLHKKTPNVNNQTKGNIKDLYSRLSEVAHFSTTDVVNLISKLNEEGNINTANIFPNFSSDCLECYKFHFYVVFNFIGRYIIFAETLYPDYDPVPELKMYVCISELHKNSKFLNNITD